MIRLSRLLAITAIVMLAVAQLTHAGVVNYSGQVVHEFGGPVSGSLVVIGAFAPGFEVSQYNCIYGDDFCNLDFGTAFTDAVADGNFIPIDDTLTGFDGSFSDNGFTSLPDGTQLTIFAFEGDMPTSFFQAMHSGLDPSWFVSSAGNTIDAGQVRLTVVPFPEPVGLVMVGIVLPAVASVRLRVRSR
jgi:hypothetical protein